MFMFDRLYKNEFYLLVYNNGGGTYTTEVLHRRPSAIREYGRAEKIYRFFFEDNILHVELLKNRYGDSEHWELTDSSQIHWEIPSGLIFDIERGILHRELQ